MVEDDGELVQLKAELQKVRDTLKSRNTELEGLQTARDQVKHTYPAL